MSTQARMPPAAGARDAPGVAWITLPLALVLASWAVPSWWGFDLLREEGWWGLGRVSAEMLAQGVALLFALLLAASDPRGSGLRVGSAGGRWRGVLLVCALPVLLAAAIYPLLPVRPFAGAGPEMWLISPAAQDLLFLGFLYGRLEPRFGRPVPALPGVPAALPLAGLFFALWHLPNLFSMPAGYVAFQLAYAWAGFVLAGLSRVWTGSILYAVASHMAVNYIVWAAGR